MLLPAQRADPSSTPETSLADAEVFRDRWSWWLSHPPVVQQISPHLVDPAQITLFDARRNWSCLSVGALDELPALTPTAQALVEEFDQHALRHGWNTMPRVTGRKTLRLLLAWVDAEAPIHEADIRALADRRSTTIRRVLQFLDAKGMVVPDPTRQGDPIERALHRRISTLPGRIAEELHRWMLVLQGQGRRPHPAFPFTTIRTYFNALAPVLNAWADRVTSLREITTSDIQAAIDDQPPATARNLLPALRSLFRALKQEKLIFRDPTRGITMAAQRRLPAPIPTDQLRGLIDRADGPLAKLVVALVAIHALGKKETDHLLLADLDLLTGQLHVTRNDSRHTVYLDELTHALAIQWVRERRRLWPRTTNPYLLVSRITAADPTHSPIARTLTDAVFRRADISPGRLRRDRILDEAAYTADPIHLMRVFGISGKVAMKYVQAAHPERRTTGPR
ncbi:hypothetical protein ABZ912_43440 [Nonomuraea angiospora]|uniref:hypothetical protein n=1 Tax=Nonomuraea angiospora TaxID=46172 RepID=UPI0033E15307